MILKNKKIAIIGAGPVGLTMARLLQQKGADVSVYERDADALARIWGGTLDLHESSGQAALKAAGLLERYFALAKPMGRTITDEQGKVLFSVPPNVDTPEINRNDLRTILIDSLTSGTVVWGSKFTGLDIYEGKWLLHFEGKADVPADFVIGANGGMSNARSYVTDAVAAYSGTFIIQGEVFEPEINCAAFYELCGDNILMTSFKGVNLVANPDNNGALTYNVTFRQSALDIPDIRTFLSDMIASWGDCYQQLLRSTSSFVGLPSRKLSLDIPWKGNRPLPITLIGDAAHLMPPFAGQGVNTGLMDALILSENLSTFERIDAAISDYERQMVVYAGAAQRETGKNELAMHEEGFSFQRRFD